MNTNKQVVPPVSLFYRHLQQHLSHILGQEPPELQQQAHTVLGEQKGVELVGLQSAEVDQEVTPEDRGQPDNRLQCHNVRLVHSQSGSDEGDSKAREGERVTHRLP